ncbi:MAG TPA: ribosome-associated translation inhibitor RaiA [Vicinamibacterales bacterium]|nr:ribosome-associated translation inhibitor RaiA [Vicinamibacterales bacterium]
MRLDITGRHVDITPALRQLIDKRLVRLGKLLNDSAISAQVILAKEKYRLQSEIVVHARDDRTLRGSGEDRTWAASIRQASVKIEQQAQKVKGKWEERKRRAASPRAVADADAASAPAGPRIIRASRYAVKPMSIEDAALQVAARPESFVVFRNAESDAVSILYKRKDGNLGLIEPD